MRKLFQTAKARVPSIQGNAVVDAVWKCFMPYGFQTHFFNFDMFKSKFFFLYDTIRF